MKRYGVPRIAFINKLDRMGANPNKAIDGRSSYISVAAALKSLKLSTIPSSVRYSKGVKAASRVYPGAYWAGGRV